MAIQTSTLPAEAARSEMDLSRSVIEAALVARPQHLAYPVGDPTSAGPRESSGRWLSATVAPQRAKASVTARPMPEAAPVTSTAFPVRSALIMSGAFEEIENAEEQDDPAAPAVKARSVLLYCLTPEAKGGRDGHD